MTAEREGAGAAGTADGTLPGVEVIGGGTIPVGDGDPVLVGDGGGVGLKGCTAAVGAGFAPANANRAGNGDELRLVAPRVATAGLLAFLFVPAILIMFCLTIYII